ncbi:hypothetical protein GCM10010124_21440 [Pilimelia terevasa]|uniref:Carboxypeptidase regulatory-like domain-containing protein n=1 Tax=Pilimelia terevasa TaxID=53372 RepID=A0A8J3FI61_9ACTN|nr:carboxypeptidase-like regulatory domain-containing protein [Pilimelia terevasa]GGK28497.1 hypothetical protein GCM10010124_21440 [Pilimelia terevasa]
MRVVASVVAAVLSVGPGVLPGAAPASAAGGSSPAPVARSAAADRSPAAAAAVVGTPRAARLAVPATGRRAGTGSIVATATDAATGVALDGVCAQPLLPTAQVASVCGTGGSATVDNIPAGTVTVAVWTAPHRYYVGAAAQIVVAADSATPVAVALGRGGVITAAVTDPAGAAVPDATVEAFAHTGAQGHVSWGDTDAAGAAETPPVPPGTYRLFATPPAGSPLGRQWVGPAGGTGREHLAAQVTVAAGTTTAAPPVRLDPAGAVHGAVSTPAGADVPAWVHLRTEYAWDAADGVAADAAGKFTYPGLGPYDWALRLSGTGFAHQWAGGAATSETATGVQVTAGETAEVALRAVPGVHIRGRFAPVGPGENLRFIEVFDAGTGARLGISNTDADEPRYDVWALGGGDARLRWVTVVGNGPELTDGWYDRAALFADATPVTLPRGGRLPLDITAR